MWLIRIKCKIRLLNVIRIIYHYRENNKAANFLAKLDNQGVSNMYYFVNPLPLALLKIVEKDAVGTLQYIDEGLSNPIIFKKN